MCSVETVSHMTDTFTHSGVECFKKHLGQSIFKTQSSESSVVSDQFEQIGELATISSTKGFVEAVEASGRHTIVSYAVYVIHSCPN